jgi:hypothetical protein
MRHVTHSAPNVKLVRSVLEEMCALVPHPAMCIVRLAEFTVAAANQVLVAPAFLALTLPRPRALSRE